MSDHTTRTLLYPVVRWTTIISIPQNCNNNMFKYLNNRCRWFSPSSRNKTRVRNHEWHAFLRSRSNIMLWFYKIYDVETHHEREIEKNRCKIYKCCCSQDHKKNSKTTRSSELVVLWTIAYKNLCQTLFYYLDMPRTPYRAIEGKRSQ